MKPFLYAVAEAFYRKYGSEVSRIAFVFPNRRAGIFFQKYLVTIAGHPLFSPPVLTVSELLTEITGYVPADRISMLFILYEHFKRLSHSEESFDNFLFWGEMLLNDFDDADKYLVEVKQLFTNIRELKEIDESFNYLTDEQVEAIRCFWAHFIPAQESAKKRQFIAVWEILHSLYSCLKEELKKKGIAYEGMIFREAAERVREGKRLSMSYEKVVCVGLNALCKAEEIVLKQLKADGIADFYWDYESPYVRDKENRASYFCQRNRMSFPSALSLEMEDRKEEPVIELIGVPSAVGEAKHVQTILTGLLSEKAIPGPKKAINTAVILPDEGLLLPVLHSIPDEIDPINVSMGYTLSSTPIAGLMKILFDLQNQIRYMGGYPRFYYKKVLAVLSHRYVLASGESSVNALADDIRKYNKIFISVEELAYNDLLETIFRPLETTMQAADYLLEVLLRLQRRIPGQQDGEEDREDEETPAGLTSLEREFLFHYYLTVKRLKEVITEYGVSMDVTTFFRLIERMASSITIPFRGEPLSGLQIMGVPETRALDFENLIILSMNEGVFPVQRYENTFIPYNLRKGFGMPTTEQRDCMYAYNFYRLLYRAKRIYFLYDTRNEGVRTGEVSRYIYQLKYLYKCRIAEKQITYDIEVIQPKSIEIAKTEHVQAKLRSFLAGGNRALSASALNTYLNCPMQFYLQYVERISEPDEVSESVEASTFGNIYHQVMEYLYRPFCGKPVTADVLERIQKNEPLLTGYIERAFASNYFKTEIPRPLTGQNFLVGEVIRKYVKQTLKKDRKYTPFVYRESEREILTEYRFDGDRRVRLKGFIDRIDEREGKIRIIDYKTGSGKTVFRQIDELFDKTLSMTDRPKAVMQVFMYALMYKQLFGNVRIEPGIFYLRTLFKEDFDWAIQYKPELRGGSVRVEDFNEYETDFRKAFTECLQEIFNPDVPFYQTQHNKNCAYCLFSAICKR